MILNAFLLGAFLSPSLGNSSDFSKKQLRFLISSLEKEIRASAKNSQQRYFLYFFSYQDKENKAANSHTFASFIKVLPDASQQWISLSWLPYDFDRTRKICVFRNFFESAVQTVFGNPCPAVKGKNFSLEETLLWGLQDSKLFGIWGPFPISQEFYFLAKIRKHDLLSRDFLYIADDRRTRPQGGAFNCMHAVSDLPGYFDKDPFFLRNFPSGVWGFRGTQNTIRHYNSLGTWALKNAIDPKAYRVYILKDSILQRITK